MKSIKEGYTDDVKTAKQAYYLAMAKISDIYYKKSEEAIDRLDTALNVISGEITEITGAVKEYKAKLTDGKMEDKADDPESNDE